MGISEHPIMEEDVMLMSYDEQFSTAALRNHHRLTDSGGQKCRQSIWLGCLRSVSQGKIKVNWAAFPFGACGPLGGCWHNSVSWL